MGILMTAIRGSRFHPANVSLMERYRTQLESYRRLCEKMKIAIHKKTKVLKS